MLRSVNQIEKWRAEGYDQLRCGIHLSAAQLFHSARAKCESEGLRQLAGEFAASASDCELQLGQFEKCAQSCRAALLTKPPSSSVGILKARLGEALQGIKKLQDGERPAKTPEPDLRLLEIEDAKMNNSESHVSDCVATAVIDGVKDDSGELTSPSFGQMLTQIAELKAERDSALNIAAERENELAASKASCQELQHKCEQLAQERDALSETVERLRQAAETQRRKMQELEDLYPHLGAAVERIGKLIDRPA